LMWQVRTLPQGKKFVSGALSEAMTMVLMRVGDAPVFLKTVVNGRDGVDTRAVRREPPEPAYEHWQGLHYQWGAPLSIPSHRKQRQHPDQYAETRRPAADVYSTNKASAV
jgi:hypothetical protein